MTRSSLPCGAFCCTFRIPCLHFCLWVGNLMGECPVVEDMDLSAEVAAGCMCFRGFGWGGVDGSSSYRHLGEEGNRDWWVLTKAKEVKAMSELLAGPKWKNFIRKFSVQMQARRIKRVQFGYDAEGYALNFDDGNADEEDDRRYGFMATSVESGDKHSDW